jgi:hypothetical protein
MGVISSILEHLFEFTELRVFFPAEGAAGFLFPLCSAGFCSFVSISGFDSIFAVPRVKKQG